MRTNLWYIALVIMVYLFISPIHHCYAQKDTTRSPKTIQKLSPEERQARKKARREKFLSTLPPNHNPKTATLLALLPGAGQIYNRRYWKLPIVYGGLGALTYFTATNYIEYNCYRTAYLHTVDKNPNTADICRFNPTADSLTLKVGRDEARTNAETFLLLSILFYGLTITDAFVDAHLMKFDIDDDLSMTVQPQMSYDFRHSSVVPGVGITVQARQKPSLVYPVEF